MNAFGGSKVVHWVNIVGAAWVESLRVQLLRKATPISIEAFL